MWRYAPDVASYVVPAPTFSVSSGSYHTPVLSVMSGANETYAVVSSMTVWVARLALSL